MERHQDEVLAPSGHRDVCTQTNKIESRPVVGGGRHTSSEPAPAPACSSQAWQFEDPVFRQAG